MLLDGPHLTENYFENIWFWLLHCIYDVDRIVTCERHNVGRETENQGIKIMETLSINGKNFTDCRKIDSVSGNVKAPSGTIESVVLDTFEMLNVSGDVNSHAVRVAGFGKVKTFVFHKGIEEANTLIAAQSKFFI